MICNLKFPGFFSQKKKRENNLTIHTSDHSEMKVYSESKDEMVIKYYII